MSGEEIREINCLATIAEFTESSGDTDPGNEAMTTKTTTTTTTCQLNFHQDIKYYLVDDSPMAKFSRSIKWAYKKVSKDKKDLMTFRLVFNKLCGYVFVNIASFMIETQPKLL